MNDFVLIKDNFLNARECDHLISYLESNTQGFEESPLNYSYTDFYINQEVFPNRNIWKEIVDLYSNAFPQINYTEDKWFFYTMRIKKFMPGKFFERWHCEDSLNEKRVACALIYLSTHKCGTEFFDGSIIKSKRGRLAIFPTYWTHVHRGQPCPQNKERYIVSGYFIQKEYTE